MKVLILTSMIKLSLIDYSGLLMAQHPLYIPRKCSKYVMWYILDKIKVLNIVVKKSIYYE